MDGHTKAFDKAVMTTAKTPGKVEIFLQDGQSSAMSRIRTHSGVRPADYKRITFRH